GPQPGEAFGWRPHPVSPPCGRLRLPVLQPDAQPDGARERRADHRDRHQSDEARGSARPRRSLGQARSLPGRALRRPAAARGGRQGDRQAAGGAVLRRAHRLARLGLRRPGAGGDHDVGGGDRRHGDDGHPQRRRRRDRRPGDPLQRRQGRRDRRQRRAQGACPGALVRTLDVKLLRDLRRLAPQVAAIALLGAIGVAVAVMANGALKAVVVAQDRYYAQTRFADVFATAERAPNGRIRGLRAIDGVVAVDTRATGGGLLPVPGLDRPAHVQLISLPRNQATALNQIVLAAGRLPAAGRRNEAVGLKAFLDAAHVQLGQTLTATISGRRVSFVIVGSALSPEYVYSPSESFLPDDAHQAVLWAPPDQVEAVTGQVGAFNPVALKLAGGVAPDRVLPQVDRLLSPYGGAPAVARIDQPSHRFLHNEVRQLRILTLILPPVFLLV